MSDSLKGFHPVTVTIPNEGSMLTGLKCFLPPQALWVMIQPKRKWEVNICTPPLWLQCIAIGLLLMCLATISSWSCNSCTMLMLSRCSQWIKSCDNSIGKLGVIMENVESAGRLTVTWSSWNSSGVGHSGSAWHTQKLVWVFAGISVPSLAMTALPSPVLS